MRHFAVFIATVGLFLIMVAFACKFPASVPAPHSPQASPLAESPVSAIVTVSAPPSAIPSSPNPDNHREIGASLPPITIPQETRLFRILPEASEARYEVNEILFRIFSWNRAIGRTRSIQGEFHLTPQGYPIRDGNWFKVDISTLTSNSANRYRMIQVYWLESEQNPLAEFVDTTIEPTNVRFEEGQRVRFGLMGNMTFRQVTRPLTFEVEANLQGDTIYGTAKASLRMKDFDPPEIPLVVWVEDDVTIVMEVSAKAVTPWKPMISLS